MASAAAAPADGGNGKANGAKPLTGVRLALAGFVLAMANFIVVLDTTIANVSVPHISGGLAVSVTSGTWVITSYAVAEAICVPLTGWLAQRFGTLRVFLLSLAGFGVFSALCGLSGTLSALVVFRLGQGFCGGPLMPLTQTLMMRIFPKEAQPKAMAMWAMTVVTAPIAGPILGGYISDNWSWEWIFFINVPIVVLIFFGVLALLRDAETPTRKVPIDRIGLLLLVIWVGAFQMMLDLGRDEDWFNSTRIVVMACVAAVFFAVFVIWELTEKHPVVDLSVFRHRGFSASTASLTIAFGTYFASIVILPQWLQLSMGYTATMAGHAMAFSGVLALIVSPLVPGMMKKLDPRLIVFMGISWLGVCSLMRAGWSTDVTFATVILPQLLQGAGMAMMIVPLTTIGLASVDPEETASAAGISNFGRTLAGAVATALVTTMWHDASREKTAILAGNLNGAQAVSDTLQNQGFSAEQARSVISQLVEAQGMALGTTEIFALSGVALFAAAMTIWLAPRPAKDVKAASGH
ncbi:DHA2 family efflux MFS transporter permease subunit [Novosphingobium naphthalenivorans]|uniref:DHA2 family efflux MFS transporter permease subunit n=1 Tax=Novosphingobium naphthalenivorans TaxID=273168 RepID=UPI0009FC5459|nr:DHA2 family efflux MFS transporter permease subunit [Novosphingobium naphthalenivorans]